MKKTLSVIPFGILFLFFIQSVGTLIESIYILDLMHTTLDVKVLGLLFLFVPAALILLARRFPQSLMWITFIVMFIGRSLLPWLNTADRMLASGCASSACLSLIFLLIGSKRQGEEDANIGLTAAAGLGLAICLSTLLRTVYFGVDYSLAPAGGWSGVLLGLVLGGMLINLKPTETNVDEEKTGGITTGVVGLLLVLVMAWFSFSAPAVIARWTEGNYTLIVMAVSLLAAVSTVAVFFRPQILAHIDRPLLLAWNLAFSAALGMTLFVHKVGYPLKPQSAAVIIGQPEWWQAIPLVLMLLLFPVLFIDLAFFVENIKPANQAPGKLVPGILVGIFALILFVFANIFTNVWGYVQPVSGIFRGQYWLVFLVLAVVISLLALLAEPAFAKHPRSETKGTSRSRPLGDMSRRLTGRVSLHKEPEKTGKAGLAWAALMAVICLATLVRAIPGSRVTAVAADKSILKVMTCNIQGANDTAGEKSFEGQLALIKQVSPDLLSLQETDTARISFNNNDYVRFYAENLGYYSYYGPTTTAGTFGTSILSRYPLLDTRSVYTFSDTDEIGVAEAEIEVSGRIFNIYDVHPDGSDGAMLTFAQALLDWSRGQSNVIALGDYNLRDYEAAYQLINSVYTNVWTSVYPSKISPEGVDMSGENRIDHIFISHDLAAKNPVYLLPPASQTDHPVLWSEIFWGK